jgi:fatty-acyl-CoA synthase
MKLEGICPLTTAEALRRAVAIAPEIEAVVGPDGRLTFAELEQEVSQLRAALIASGVGKGDHVGICLGNGTRWLALFLAIGSAGAVTVPVNTRFRLEEMRYCLGQSRVRLLFLADRVLTNDFGAMIRELCPAIGGALPDPALPDLREIVLLDGAVPAGATAWEEFVSRATEPAEPRCTPDDVLLMQYTSGTTSFPKGVMLPHRNMLANAFFASGRMGLRVADRYHSARPFFHVAGSTLSILAALQAVCTLVTMDRFEPGEALRLLEAERCTHVSGNDTMAVLLLNHPDLPKRQLVLRGGWAAAKPTIMRRFMHELGAIEAVSTYGMSEGSGSPTRLLA